VKGKEAASFDSGDLQRPSEKSNLRWSSSAAPIPMRDQMEEAEHLAAEAEALRIQRQGSSSIHAVTEVSQPLANTPMLRMSSTPVVSNVPNLHVEIPLPERAKHSSEQMSFENLGFQ